MELSVGGVILGSSIDGLSLRSVP